MVSPVRIGVAPAGELIRRARLLAALAEAYPVRFVAPGEAPEAIVAFGRVPETTLPTLALIADESAHAGDGVEVALADDIGLARPLRGAALSDRHLPRGGVAAAPSGGPATAMSSTRSASDLAAASSTRSTWGPAAGTGPDVPRGAVLASADGRPVWTRVGDRLQLGAAAPLELEEPEALRDRLAPGRNAALLPLAHFLAELTADRRWHPGPPHAAIVLDDPNLHWPTYGRVRYAELARHAAEHDYHVSMAMVPLDAWLVHPRAARTFAAQRDRISLSIHGNDHTGPELGRPQSDAEGTALGAEALRRMKRLERRTGIAVSRVMVPPHERVSEAAAHGLRACDYDALCTTRPYPWMVSGLTMPWLTRPAGASVLAGWHSVDVVAGGLPVLLRSAFFHPREDIVLRAFLGQPLILYGHHDDLDAELGLMAEVAGQVNRVGDVRWGSLGDLARNAYEVRREGEALHVRARARRVRVDVPEGVSHLEVDLSVLELPATATLRTGGRSVAGTTVAVEGPGPIELAAAAPSAPVAAPRAALHSRAWPHARRWASEVRDRMEPVRARGA